MNYSTSRCISFLILCIRTNTLPYNLFRITLQDSFHGANKHQTHDLPEYKDMQSANRMHQFYTLDILTVLNGNGINYACIIMHAFARMSERWDTGVRI